MSFYNVERQQGTLWLPLSLVVVVMSIILLLLIANGPALGQEEVEGPYAKDALVFQEGQDMLLMTFSYSGTVESVRKVGEGHNPSLSNTGWIAYECGPDICAVDADGMGKYVLVQDAYDPALSPDGTKLAYVSEQDGNVDIYLLRTRLFSDTVPLTPTQGLTDTLQLAQVVTQTDALTSTIVITGTPAITQTRVTTNTAIDVQPSWSVDGTGLVFSSDRWYGSPTIYSVTVGQSFKLGRPQKISQSAKELSHPGWGRYLFVYQSSDSDGDMTIYRLLAWTEAYVEAVVVSGWHPAVFEDNAIAYVSQHKDGKYMLNRQNVEADESGWTHLWNSSEEISNPDWGKVPTEETPPPEPYIPPSSDVEEDDDPGALPPERPVEDPFIPPDDGPAEWHVFVPIIGGSPDHPVYLPVVQRE